MKSSRKRSRCRLEEVERAFPTKFTRFTSPPLLPASYLHTSPKYPPNIATSLPDNCRAVRCYLKTSCPLTCSAAGPYRRSCQPARMLIIGRLLVTAMSRQFWPLPSIPEIKIVWCAVDMRLPESDVVAWLPHKLIASASLAGWLVVAANTAE
jgi:hypothetical protein